MTARAAITGVGVLSAFGPGKEALSRALIAGPPAFSCRRFGGDGRLPLLPPLRAAYLPEFTPSAYLGRKGLRSISRDAQVFMSAAVMACADAELNLDACDRAGVGVFVGTTSAGVQDYLQLMSDTEFEGIDRFDPMLAPQTGFNAPASQLSFLFRAQGPNLTLTTGTAAGADAVAYAADFIRTERADIIFAGGIDTLSFIVASELIETAGRARASVVARPFDRDRDGPVPGEAACVLVIEDADHARRRGARVLAEIAGSAAGFETGCKRSSAAARTLRRALDAANCRAGDIGAVFASGSGHRAVDAAEADALHDVFGGDTVVCGTKGSVGECRGAAGTLQIAAALASLEQRVVPPTAGFDTPDPDLPPLSITTRPDAITGRWAAIHSLDPAGHSSALVLNAA